MIQAAKQFNRHGERCQYRLNTATHLRAFPDSSFDLVYSCITLQHLPRRHTRAYLAEFLRVLHPQGLLVFQLPDRYHRSKDWLTYTIYGLFMRTLLRRTDVMEMHGIAREPILELVAASGGEVVLTEEDSMAGPKWLGWRYFVRRARRV